MPPVPLYPLRFKPIFKPAIWGGRRLADMFPGAPAEGPIGETWVLSDHNDDVSVVAEGRLAGTGLHELVSEHGKTFLGPALAHYDTFPLLLKFIDARESLSVQVHPTDEFARTLACVARGKTEAWVVIHAEPGSRIYAGLKKGVGRLELERSIVAGTVADSLHSFEPAVGDCVYLPSGTIHALGAGITVFEVQQTSDTTYRLFDWNRVDAKTGKPRDLHVDRALASTNFSHGPVRPVEPKLESGHGGTHCLVDCKYFDLRRTELNFLSTKRVGRRSTVYHESGIRAVPECRIVVPLSGRMRLRSVQHGGSGVELRKNEIALIPAGTDLICGPPGPISFLDIRPR